MPDSHTASRTPRPVVLHVRVVTETGGGPEKTIFNSPRYLSELGYSCRCAYLHPPRDPGFAEVRRQARRAQAPLDAVPDRGPFDLCVALKLLRLCKTHGVRIWHGHDYKSNVLGVLLSRVWPMRLVTTVHGWIPQMARMPFYYALDRLSLRCFDRVICVSPDLRQECVAAGVRESRCVLIENGIDSRVFRRTRSSSEAKAERSVPKGRLVVGAIGRLSAEKRFGELIPIVDRLVRNGIDCELWIVGDGGERKRLESLVRERGLAGRIRLLGYRSDVLELLQAMDVLALYSSREGLPNAVLEAMACEVPVVATDVGGISQVINHQHNGMLVDAGDARGFGDALARLLRRDGERRALARAARANIEERFSFQTRVERVAAIYDQVLAQTPGVPQAIDPLPGRGTAC